MTYELWDGDSGNALGAYASEADALAVIRNTIRQYGREAVVTFALLRVNSRGRSKVVAEGAALADRALAAAPTAPCDAAEECAPIPT